MLLLALITVGPASINLAATDDREEEKKLTEMIHSYHKYGGNFDYGKLAGDVHPNTLAAFRQIVDRMLIRMVDKYGFAGVMSIFDGISNLRELDKLDNQQYWIFLMGTSGKFFEEKNWDEPVRILSTVEDEKALIVTYVSKRPPDPLLNKDRMRTINVKSFRRHKGKLKYSGVTNLWVELVFEMYLQSLQDELTPYLEFENLHR